jgi:hypothetical protein
VPQNLTRNQSDLEWLSRGGGSLLKTTICLIAVLMCAWVSSYGQDADWRQWKVVKEGQVTDSCATVNQVLFTPTHEGLYRFSAYLSLSSTMNFGALVIVGDGNARSVLH